MYKFLGKPGKLYDIDKDEIIMKLNYKCPKNPDGTFNCNKEKDETNESDSTKKDQLPKELDSNIIKNKIVNGTPLTQEEKNFMRSKLTNTNSVISKVKKEISLGKKPSKETINELKSSVTELKNFKTETKLKSENEKTIPAESSSSNGLTKIKEEINKAGGPEEFFKLADTHSKGQEERKPIDSNQAGRIVGLYTNKDTFKKPYKEENGIKWYKQDNEDTSIIVAKKGNKVAAYALKASDPDDPKNPYTTIVASTDFKGKGIGKQAMLEFYNNYPEMIKKTGGLTPMGKQAYLKTLKTIAVEETPKQNMTLDEFSMYKFIGKNGQLYSIDPDENVMKLNYKCPKDKYVPDSFKCGNTPEEAKKNFEAEKKIKSEKQKGLDERRGKRAERVSSKAEKRIAKIKDPVLLEKTTVVKSLIEKARGELASGKVSKQTYKELRTAVNALRESVKNPVSEQLPKKNPTVQKPESNQKPENPDKGTLPKDSYKGIYKLKEDIIKAGGPDKYFNKFIKPNSENLKPTYRKPLNTQQLDEKYLDQLEMFELKPYKEENGLSFYEIPDYKSDEGKKLVTIVALKDGHVAGYARNYSDGTDKYKSKGINYDGNDAVVSTDLQKSGIGSKLLVELYNKNPEAIKYPGGLTPAGKAATISLLKKIHSGSDILTTNGNSETPKNKPILSISKSKENYTNLINDSKKLLKQSKEYASIIEDYTDIDTCSLVNTYLAGNTSDLDTDAAKEAVSSIDKVFKNIPETSQDMLLWRTPTRNEISRLLPDGKKLEDLVGETLERPTFTSTSRNENVGKSFGNRKNSAYYEIKVPSGSKALSIENEMFPDTDEVLLNRNIKWRVDDVSKDSNGLYKISVTLL